MDEEMLKPRECRACREGYFVGRTTGLQTAIANIVKDYAFSVSLPILIDEIYILGDKERETMISEGKDDPGEWSREDIYNHLFYCMTDFTLFILKEVKHLQSIIDRTKDSIFVMDDSGNPHLDEKAAQQLLKLQLQVKALMNTAPEKSVSFNANIVRRRGGGGGNLSKIN
jgi:hypothetical protein